MYSGSNRDVSEFDRLSVGRRRYWLLLVITTTVFIVSSHTFSSTFIATHQPHSADTRNNFGLDRRLDSLESLQVRSSVGATKNMTVQQGRQWLLNEQCSHYNTSSKPDWYVFLSDATRGLLACLTPKVASTSWARTLLKMTGKISAAQLASSAGKLQLHILVDGFVRRLDGYAPQKLKFKLKHYYKFMFVREPLERLVSAYRDKMIDDELYSTLRQNISRIFSNSSAYRSKTSTNSITFQEFVRYVLTEANRSTSTLDRHWRPQHDVCVPCHIRYDFIGHYETLQSDARLVLQQFVGRDSNFVEFPRTEKRTTNRNESSSGGFTYRQLYDSLDTSDIRGLLKLYELDYSLFGFDYPQYIRQRLMTT